MGLGILIFGSGTYNMVSGVCIGFILEALAERIKQYTREYHVVSDLSQV